MRPKSLVLLMLALGCGLVASIGISQVMDRKNQQPLQAGETEAIFVAMKDIGFGDPLNMQVLKLEPWPKHLIPAGALSKIEDVEGRLAGARFVAGEPVLEAKLMGNGEGSGPAVAIPRGYRVVSVQVDAVSSIGSLIKPGDRVDLLVYVNRNPSSGITEAGTKTILQDVKVFAVNEQWRRPEDQNEESIAAKTVSLLVTPAQAEKVTLATEMGKVRLVLRSPEDDAGDVATGGTVVSDIFASASEKADRDREGSNEPRKPEDNTFLSWLEGQKAKQSLPTEVAIGTPETFVMELLTGNEMRTVPFRKENGTARWQVADGGFIPSQTEPATVDPIAPPVDEATPAPEDTDKGQRSEASPAAAELGS